jgi:GT2 family glycosyltransferase
MFRCGQSDGPMKNLWKLFFPKVQTRSLKYKETGLFHDAWYARTYLGDEAKKNLSWDHFLKLGSSLGYDPSVFFDTDWYLQANPEVAKSGKNPFFHFLDVGWKQGLDPNPQFSVKHYLLTNPDIKESGINPLIHFSHFGFIESRSPYQSCWPTELIPWTLASTFNSKSTPPRQVKEIAVLIPVYNNWHMTERCLRSVFRSKDASKFDVYIVNDGSTDDTLAQLDRYPQVEIINTPENLGFTKACNFAFQTVGEYKYLYLLNNDTEVQDGFMDLCLDVMVSNPKAGLVGSTLHFADGTLQSCGGIVWSDVFITDFGRGSTPSGIEFSFSRQVDYCSGAGILIDNEALKIIDYFDEIYAPANFEDTDLAFKMRSSGYEVWVASSSRIIHYEGISYGSDVDRRALANLNREKFRNKWSEVLMSHLTSTADNRQILKAAMRLSKFGSTTCIMCKALI